MTSLDGTARTLRTTRSALGNAAVALVLLALSLWLLRLHARPWFVPVVQPAAWAWAAGATLAYLVFAAWTWRRPAAARAGDAIQGDVLVAYASQTGFAVELAERTAASLREAGHAAHIADIARVDAAALAAARACLFVASTTGEGDAPDHALAFEATVMASPAPTGTSYAVLALGDRTYAHYCAFGQRLDAWLLRSGARPLFDRVEVDNADDGALRHWQHHLALFAGAPELTEWAQASYARWTLHARRLLNAGSPGGAVFHLELRPPAGTAAQWSAGDIAEIGPRHGDADVQAWLGALSMDPGAAVRDRNGDATTLAGVAARSHLSDAADMQGLDAQVLAARLEPLPSREYSIASIPAEGAIHLLLRRMLRPDGTPGLGSAWLCDHAAVGGSIDLRIRRNPGFHPPADGRPLVLIGNGTGIAGLRALLKARIAAGHHRNWLFFGERTRAHDFHHGAELQAWHAGGNLERMDLAFSRDGGTYRHVQDALRARREEVRAWLAQGAAVYVCGSLQGMAPAVDAELASIVGADVLRAMAADGRYRRDVY